jgi:hypothetical protein
MTTLSGFRPKPEEEELQSKRKELGDLEKQLIERELQLVSLRRELAAFERLYTEKVGIRYAELDEVEAQIAQLIAERDLDDVEAQEVAREARARAEESQADVAGIVAKDAMRFSPSPSLRSLYREVARRIHPDLAVDEVDRAKRQRLMADANRAYENGDEARLRAILEEYESSPDSVIGEGAGADLVRVIRKIAQVKRRLAEIDTETKVITESDLFELKKKVDDGAVQGREVINEMVSSVTSRINDRRETLKRMERTRKK